MKLPSLMNPFWKELQYFLQKKRTTNKKQNPSIYVVDTVFTKDLKALSQRP